MYMPHYEKQKHRDLDEIKLSCEAPIPKAPPSDLCNKIITTNMTAKIILNTKIKFSI